MAKMLLANENENEEKSSWLLMANGNINIINGELA